MDPTVQNNTAQAKEPLTDYEKRFIKYDNEVYKRLESSFGMEHLGFECYLQSVADRRLMKKQVPRDSKIDKLFKQFCEEKIAEAVEAENKIEAAKESEKKMASKNKADSDDNDNSDFKKNNLDSDVSDDSDTDDSDNDTVDSDNDTVDSDKEKNDEEDYTKGKESSQFGNDIPYLESNLSEATKIRRARALENNDEEEYFSLKCVEIHL